MLTLCYTYLIENEVGFLTDKQQYDINIEIQPAPDSEKQAKIYWHSAFYNAIQLSFVDYLHQLEFTDEYYLSLYRSFH